MSTNDLGQSSRASFQTATQLSSVTSFESAFRYSRSDQIKSKCKRCAVFCYNKERHTCCNRTLRSWAKILLYYAISMLSIFSTLIIVACVLYYRSSSGRVSFRKIDLYNDAAPGFAFFPSNPLQMISIVWYTNEHGKDYRNSAYYTNQMKQFLDEQKDKCDKLGNTCSFKKEDLGPCGEKNFGYDDAPCLFLKLNLLENWLPSVIREDDLEKDIVPTRFLSIVKNDIRRVWVHCGGVTSYDTQKLGTIKYYPDPWYDEKYFPVILEEDPNPVIAIQFMNPTPGFIIKVQCSIFAKNIVDGLNNRIETFIFKDM